MAAPSYTLRFKNRSNAQHDFLVFQQDPNVNAPSAYALAWFAVPLANGVDVDVTWTLDYVFVWTEQGQLVPGIAFKEMQVLPADLKSANRVKFTQLDSVLQFADPTGTGTPGSLTIDCDNTIPPNTATVGIGMSGAPTFVVPAAPNMTMLFTPHPEYWISFGDFVPGQVLDAESIAKAEQVVFPANVYGMTATLDSGNNWTIQQGLA
jgi:hypothetical protein